MTRKLTLSADADTIRRAKRFARQQGVSLSSLFARWVRAATSTNGGKSGPSQGSVADESRFSPTVQRLAGIVTLPADADYDKLLADVLQERYGSKR